MEYRRYCAFISYRHYTPDMEIAQRLHTLIEQYTIPVELRKDPKQKHPGAVFRDQEELPLSANLGKDIETALDNSDWLICVCSPRYLESRWCMRELEYFIEKHGRERVLTLLAEGEPDESFPETLLHYTDVEGKAVDLEPLAADVRSDTLRGSLKRLKKEKLRILAPMLGTTFDGLYQRARRRTRRNLLTVAAAVAVAAAGVLAYTAEQNRRVESERAAAARNEADLLLERASAELSKNKKAAALDTTLQALAISDSLGGYRERNIQSALKEICYAGDFSVRAKLDSSISYINNAIFPTMEFFSPDGSKVLCSPTSYSIDCCDTVTGSILWTVDSDQPFTSARWKEDSSSVVATSYSDHSLRVIDAETGEVLKNLHVPFVSNAAWARDNIWFTCEDGVVVWDTIAEPDAAQVLRFSRVAGQQSTGRVFHSRFLGFHDNEQIAVFDMQDTEKGFIYEFPYPNRTVSNYAVSPDGKKLFVHQFKTKYTCDLETDEVFWTVEDEQADRWPDSIPDSYGLSSLWAGDYIFDNCRFAGDGIYEYTLVVLDANTGETLYTMENTFCTGAAEDGEYFYCSSGIYRSKDGEYVMTPGTRTMKTFGYEGGTYEVTGGMIYDVSRSGDFLFTGSSVINAPDRGSQYRTDKYEGNVCAAKNPEHIWVSPDNAYSVIADSPGFTVLWNDGTNKQYRVRTFTPEYWIVFSPDSRLAALGTQNSALAVYELETGEQVFQSSGWFFQGAFGGFTFNKDGTMLMYTNYLNTWFCVASMETGKIIYEAHETQPAADWGFDEETGDAVIVFEDGSARFMKIFSNPEDLYTYARSLQQDLRQ